MEDAQWESSQPPAIGRRVPFRRKLGWKFITALVLFGVYAGSHLAGKGASSALAAKTRYWLHHSTSLSAIVQSVSHSVRQVGVPHTVTVKRSSDWVPMLSHARLDQGFGWHGTGQKATFWDGVTLVAPADQTVVAGVNAVVLSIHHQSGWTVTLRAGTGQHVIIKHLGSQTVHKGQTVSATTVIGRVGQQKLFLEVTNHGYPVNPLDQQEFGMHWVAR